MNPFSYDVEIYHRMIATTTDPRDILVPASSRCKKQKLFSAFKFLGGFTARRAGFVVAGGILAVGCTIRVLRNRHKRREQRRTPIRSGEKKRGSRTDAGTQTERLSCEKRAELEVPIQVDEKESLAIGKRKEINLRNGHVGRNRIAWRTHGPHDVSQSCGTDPPVEFQRKLSDVTEASDDSQTSKCHCASRNTAGVDAAKAFQVHHSCCLISAFISVLALHKAIMYARATETSPQAKYEEENNETLLSSTGTRPTMSAVRKQEISTFKNAWSGKTSRVPQWRGPAEARHPEGQNESIPKNGVMDNKNHAQGPKVLNGPNPFGIKGQDRSSWKATNRRREDTSPKDEVESSQARPSTHGSEFKSNLPISQSSSSQKSVERNQRVEIVGVSRTAEKPHEEKSPSSNPPSTFRSRRYEYSNDFRPRGKPRRRGTGRNHLPRRPYMDLDDPKPIASQHQR